LENAPETDVKCDYICDVCTAKQPYLSQYYAELKLPKAFYLNQPETEEKVEEKPEIDMKGIKIDIMRMFIFKQENLVVFSSIYKRNMKF
jgi:hypothetical protein